MSLRRRTAWLICLSLVFVQTLSLDAKEPLKFEQSAIAIPTSVYGGFLIDGDGFVWIGTTGLGVYRYDGYELKSFADSIEGLMVGSIVEDNDGLIWIASLSKGIACYDKQTGEFTKYLHDPINPNSLSSNNIGFTPQTLCVDVSNRLWVGTDGAGLCEFDKATNTWTRHKHDPNDSNSLSDDTVLAVAEGRGGVLWIGTQRGGLNRFNRKTGTWTRFDHDRNSPNSLNDHWVNSILEDKDGALWIGTKKGGLNKLDLASNIFSYYVHDPDRLDSIGANEVWSMHEDHSGGIWVCHMDSQTSGLELFDKKSGTFTRYGPDPTDPYSVGSRAISRVYENRRTKTLWVVNHDGRIDRHDNYTTRFRHWIGNPNNPNGLSGRSILPIIEDSDNIVWVGTMAGGLNRIDRSTGSITHYLPDEHDPLSIPRARITALTEDTSGTLWIGFWDGLLAKFDRETGKCIRIFEHDPSDPNSITESERLKYILEDRDDPNILWLATLKGGLDKFDKSQESFTHFKHATDSRNSLSHNSVITLYDDGNGVLWLPTYGGGLDKFDKKTETFTNYRHEVGKPNSLGSDTLYEIVEASNGNLWVARKGGISLFDLKAGTFGNIREL